MKGSGEYKFRVFTRTWWKENPDWPEGLEPCMGNKSTVTRTFTEEQARAYCEQENRKRRTPKKERLGWKHEYEAI